LSFLRCHCSHGDDPKNFRLENINHVNIKNADDYMCGDIVLPKLKDISSSW
jgi:hypothetical protein